MTLADLTKWVKEETIKHPEHKEEIIDLYQLCIDEIADGGSAFNEIHLCKESIEQLING
jgi:hypothetical protein